MRVLHTYSSRYGSDPGGTLGNVPLAMRVVRAVPGTVAGMQLPAAVQAVQEPPAAVAREPACGRCRGVHGETHTTSSKAARMARGLR